MDSVVVWAGCFFAQATGSLLLKDGQDGVSSWVKVQMKKGNTAEGKLLSHLGRDRGRVKGEFCQANCETDTLLRVSRERRVNER